MAACRAIMLVFATVGAGSPADAAVSVTADWTTLLFLEKPTHEFDEPSLGGFEYLISSRAGEFRENDHYLNGSEESSPATSLAANLGAAGELSRTALSFSIRHSLRGGRNFTFRIDDPSTGIPSVLCWGRHCPAGSTSAETLAGLLPITAYNGIQIQLRAQEVPGASATLSGLAITGVAIRPASAPLLDGTVTPVTPSTIPGDPPGRLVQWLLGDSFDLLVCEWEINGTITLARDSALEDLTKVRLAVDLVNDYRLPTACIVAGQSGSLRPCHPRVEGMARPDGDTGIPESAHNTWAAPGLTCGRRGPDDNGFPG